MAATRWRMSSAIAAGGRQGQAGAKPRFSDSEVITHQTQPGLRAGQPSEMQPPGPPAVALGQALRRRWAEALGATRASLSLLDTKPLPVVGDTRDKSRSDFAATAA